MAKKKFGEEIDSDKFELFKEQLEYGERNAREIVQDNFNLQMIPGDAEDVPGNLLDPGYGGSGILPGGLVERQGGIQYGDAGQNMEDYGFGNDGAGANLGMRLA